MKSLLAAVNLLTVAFGNLMVVIVSEVRYFENQVRKNYYSYTSYTHIHMLNMGRDTSMCLDYLEPLTLKSTLIIYTIYLIFTFYYFFLFYVNKVICLT